MHRRTAAANRVLILVALGLLLLAIAGAFGSKAIFGAISKRAQDRRAEKLNTSQTLDAAEKMLEGGELEAIRNFPDTPVGRMNRIVFEFMLEEQKRQRSLEKDLEKIGWDWVLTGESLSTKANLKESLKRLKLTRLAMAEYNHDLQASYDQLLKKMSDEATKDPDAAKVLVQFKNNQSEPGNGLYFAKKIEIELKKNQQAIQDCLEFLLKHHAAYQVDAEGSVNFKPGRDAQIDTYNAIIDRVNTSMEAVEKVEADRMRLMKRRLSDARQTAK